ncbi:MAG: Dehydrogenase (flavoprotein)-like protein [Clostridiales bacterium]|jgi:flavin-dependent dehydrogenase|nr:Dehydrogenase (flavoprotein)-like protein [Clostridiales bacterium]
MKIAIIGAGISGLACAMECEKLGVIPDVFERDYTVGWPWLSVNYWPNVIMRNMGDPVEYIKKNYNIDVMPLNECKTIILKSQEKEVKVKGKMGYFIARGKGSESQENHLLSKLKKGTALHYNSLVDYKDLSHIYDYVVIATGRDSEARELNLWEDEGIMRVVGGIAVGSFQDDTSVLYLNSDYAGTGYARITPFSPTEAIVGLYDDMHDEFDTDRLFAKFLQYEKLDKLEFLYKFTVPPFSTGRIKKFIEGNFLFVGRSAGLTERFLGVGGPEALMSGVLAARAMILNQDYEKLIEPLQKHVENISAFRKVIEKFENKDFDKLLSLLGTPGVKQTVYNTPLNFGDLLGRLIQLTNN